ncbi:hypothetical protein GC194_15380 [bacterium]|nr:hypothetical protein [bacterium]
MNILSPRERILKEVRNSLLSIKSKQNQLPEKRAEQLSLKNDDKALDFIKNHSYNHGQLIFCKNRYHFLDQFMLFLEQHSVRRFVCADKRLIQFFKSCELEHAESLEAIDQNTLAAFASDYFDPFGLFASFNYNGFVADAVKKCNHVATVAYRDQLVKGSQQLFERVKNRLDENDLRSVQMINMARHEGNGALKTAFIINQR